jgi:hypothetical protein
MKLSRFRHRRTVRSNTRARPDANAGTAMLAQPAAGAPVSAVPVDAPSGEAQPDRWAGDGSAWLPRARSFWQQGDWQALASLDPRSLQRHPDRARLTLLAAAGHFQLGDGSSTRRCVQQAMAWGCDKRMVSQALVSGLHNTLGRAASVLNQPERALTHFAAAIATGSPGSSLRAVTQARGSVQLAQLGLGLALASPLQRADPPATSATPATRANADSAPPAPATGALQSVARQSIGALSLAPGADLRPATLVHGGCQWLALAAGPGTVRVVQRPLAGGPSRIRDLEVELDPRSPGAGIALGIDRQGYLHLSYDRAGHGSRHRRSAEPLSIKSWSVEWPLPGSASAPAGLRQFVGGQGDRPLQLVVQPDGGCAHLSLWHLDEPSMRWAPHGSTPAGTSVPQAMACVEDHDGGLHVLLASALAAPGPAPDPLAVLQLVHLRRPAVDAAWASEVLPSHPVPGAPGSGMVLSVQAADRQLWVLCVRSDGTAGTWWQRSSSDAVWRWGTLPGTQVIGRDGRDGHTGRPLLLPSGAGIHGMVRCSAEDQHRVQCLTWEAGPELAATSGPSLQFCRGLAVAALAWPGVDETHLGFTLLVHEHALQAMPGAGTGTDELALHDLVFS